MRQIKFAQLSITKRSVLENIVSVLESGAFINGFYGKRFAEAWAYKCGAGHGVLTSSGSAAIRAALAAVTLPNHKYVILPALSFAATAMSVVHSGLVPVYCDVTGDGLINWDMCSTYLDNFGVAVAAVIPVHLYGQIVEIPQFAARVTTVIEDACQAHGVYALPSHSSSLACFSFYPSKNLGAAGDAGAVVTNSGGLARIMSAFINYGDYPGEKYVHSMLGDNLRCDEIQAAVLLEQLNDLDSDNTKRKAQAEAYVMSGVSSIATAKLNAWHLYPILAHKPDELRSTLHVKGIETGRHYPYTLPQVVAGVCNYEPSHAKHITKHVITLPIGPHMSEDDAAYVASALINVARLNAEGLWELN